MMIKGNDSVITCSLHGWARKPGEHCPDCLWEHARTVKETPGPDKGSKAVRITKLAAATAARIAERKEPGASKRIRALADTQSRGNNWSAIRAASIVVNGCRNK